MRWVTDFRETPKYCSASGFLYFCSGALQVDTYFSRTSRAVSIVLIWATLASSGSAQDKFRLNNRALALSLAEAATADEGSVRLSLPPLAESLVGAIVVPDEEGLRAIDRMPQGSFEASKAWEGQTPFSDSFVTAAESPLIHHFLANVGEFNEPYRTRVEATNVVMRRLTPDSVAKAKKFILGSPKASEAAKAKTKLFLVSAVYSGNVRITFELQDEIAANASAIAKDFDLSRPRPTVGTLDLVSREPVEFAYHLERIDLLLNAAGNPADLSMQPSSATDSFHASIWEKTEALLGAGPEALLKVKVFYATDRNIAPPTPSQKTKTWWVFFMSYFLSCYPYLASLIVAAVLYFAWFGFVWLGLRSSDKTGDRRLFSRIVQVAVLVLWQPLKRMWWKHALIIGAALTVAPTLAGIFAWQQTERPGVIAKNPPSSDRGPLTYGTCEVSIPKDHKIGELPPPFSLFLIELGPENPATSFSVLQRDPKSDDVFFDQLRERLKDSPREECLVFVHGYNNTFDNAAQRTAQLWVDLQFQGAPIFFSWPSRGATAGYTFDETEAAWAQSDFVAFLNRLRTEGSVKRIHIIAHSMGNRIVSGGLAELAKDGVLKSPDCKFREVVLAAADIDADTFKQSIAPRFTNQSPHVTFYASANDGALNYSHTVHDHPRAGDARDGILVLPGMDSIDVSLLDTSFDNHGYFAAHRSVVSDITLILRNGLAPGDRGLREEGAGDAKHWVFRP